ncbi:hypothetical protein GGTG_05698 [Gaeumannomyces tritici R3-111a-1]|uniref:Uncharacterized protein n=1 Tax=Gaeumannomyces tritici (strain R3-111a-1) TaxID=644352 RepID=J3NWN6_GAET3|nr:hypothetical protein GGTG_05698 [Gaeumannomyces tritici R3-111a-1]EJT75768.1 hypothetical protein GGTG_05698 [Gaeumannomyces tritici R3-111a-1]
MMSVVATRDQLVPPSYSATNLESRMSAWPAAATLCYKKKQKVGIGQRQRRQALYTEGSSELRPVASKNFRAAKFVVSRRSTHRRTRWQPLRA